MLCCERDRRTPYCPVCGKILQVPLAGLLRHLEKTKNKYATIANDHDSRGVNNAQETADKWQIWYEALKELIEAQATRQALEASR